MRSYSGLDLVIFCKHQSMFSSFCQHLWTALSLPCIYHLYTFWSSQKETKATHTTVWIPFFFLFCFPQSPFTFIINIVSNYLSWWHTLRYSSREKNIPVSIHTSCHYSFGFPKFFHRNKLLPLSSASPKKLSPLRAHLFCELLSWMCLYSVLPQK